MIIMRMGYLIIAVLAVAAAGPAWGEWRNLRPGMEGRRPEFVMLSHTSAGDRFELRLPGVELDGAVLEGKLWDRVDIYGGGFEQENGAPEVPHVTRLVALPPTAGVRVEAVILEEEIIPGVELMPAQGIAPDEGPEAGRVRHFDAARYARDAFYPDVLVRSGEPAIMRGLRVVPVQINPVRYNPVTRELRVAHRLEVQVHYEGSDPRNVPAGPPRPVSRAWADLARTMVVNYDETRNLDETLTGSYLVICEDDPDLVSKVDSLLVNWKRRKGHSVTRQTFTPPTTATAVKNLIQAAYNNWPVPPEFVLLIGDTNGDYALPAYEAFYGLDHEYGLLEGNDQLADVALGRMPAGNVTEALTLLNKVLWYEKQPYTAQPQWFHQAVVIAGEPQSGISTIQTKRWIKTRMLQHGFSRVDTLWYNMPGVGDPQIQQAIISSINSGVSYFNYRGYSGMSGWQNSMTYGLTNGYRMPFVTILTCGTGGFNGESRQEVFAVAGTPTTGQGAIACVGTATLSTNTRCNNVIDVGMYYGIFDEGITAAGNVLLRGKLELYNAYATLNSSFVSNFSKWNNLAGDPGLDLWSGPIQTMTVQAPDQMNLGDNQLTVTVQTAAGLPLPDALVCAWKPGETQVTALTGTDGTARLLLGPCSAGNLKVTVTRANYKPVLDSLNLTAQPVQVGLYGAVIDDDMTGESQGNGDGLLNPGEIPEVLVTLKNFGSLATATSVTLTATEQDPYVTPGDMFETYASLPPGAVGVCLDDIDFHLSPNTPHGHVVHLNLAVNSAQGSWPVGLELVVQAPRLEAQWARVPGISDTLVDPGETADLVVYIRNDGGAAATGVSARLRSLDPLLTVLDSIAYYGQINAGALVVNAADTFVVQASTAAPRGLLIPLQVQFTATGGIVQVDTFDLQLGMRDHSDPQGPDGYGYYCYDNTDVNYAPCPVYDWVEIDPHHGGLGALIPIVDTGYNFDSSYTVDLPFDFQYYGQAVDSITVCSNGWISMVPNAAMNLFRNWPIPSCMGPDGMVAPFWDDLKTVGGDGIFRWHDAANHRFVIEWSRLPNCGSPNPQETFEVILYDPAHYPTPTGDGEILFQYHTITEVAGIYHDNGYSTVGLENPAQNDGLEVVYSQQYHDPAASPLANGRAYLFTTRFDYTPPGQVLEITLTPTGAPIIIPPGGGAFNYQATLVNSGTAPVGCDLWIMQQQPSGQWQGPLLGPLDLTLPAGANLSRLRNQNVAGSAAAGTYQYYGYTGYYPVTVFDSSGFAYTKSGVDASGPVGNWACTGEPFPGELEGTRSVASIPETFALSASPNPFNPRTALGFTLPAPGHVGLRVYDTAGREVATLVNGWREAGVHEVTFDGSGLASGVYLVRMEAGEVAQVMKLVLLK